MPTQLTPLSMFQKTVTLYPSQPAYVYNNLMRTWGEMNGTVSQFASALRGLGIDRGDVVSFMCPNLPPILEAHFAVPGIGAVLHSINIR